MSEITHNLAQVQERIAEAALRAGRDPSEVTLVAVAKTFPAEAVIAAYRAGPQSKCAQGPPVILIHVCQVVTDGVAQVERGIRLLAHAADAGQNGVGQPLGLVQPFEAIQHNAVYTLSYHCLLTQICSRRTTRPPGASFVATD